MKLDWQDGAPENPEAGMVLEWHDGSVSIIGTEESVQGWNHANRWAWLIKPYQLEWLQDMAKRDKK